MADCDKQTQAGADAATMKSLKCLALVDRSAALLAAGQTADALQDAMSAVALGPKDEQVQKALKADGDALAKGLSGAVSVPGRAASMLEEVAPLLAKPEAAPAREQVVKVAEEPAFANALLREAVLTHAWEKAIGPFTPAGMVRVAGGPFPLGVQYTGLKALTPSSSPQHVVPLQSYCMDTREVTNAEFAAFVAAGGYAKDEYWTDSPGVSREAFVDSTGKPGPRYWANGTFPAGSGDLPVAGVSWYEAAAYARWAGKRLPTEAEWECAGCGVPAAAGASGANGAAAYTKQSFPWGNDFVAGRANLADGGKGAPAAVGTWPGDKSPAGCYDMAGNVREWTSSAYAPYPNSECQDPSLSTGLVVVRGRSYADSQIGAELTSRRGTDKKERDARIGFRCAWSPPAP